MIRVFLFLLCGCAFFCGCQEKNEDRFLERSFAIQRKIVQEFSLVRSLQELLVREETLTNLFSELSFVAIQADRWKKAHKRSKRLYSTENNEITIVLECELRRILFIPGAEAFLERCQKKALDRFDLYLRKQK